MHNNNRHAPLDTSRRIDVSTVCRDFDEPFSGFFTRDPAPCITLLDSYTSRDTLSASALALQMLLMLLRRAITL
jgi:hypothetical protein